MTNTCEGWWVVDAEGWGRDGLARGWGLRGGRRLEA